MSKVVREEDWEMRMGALRMILTFDYQKQMARTKKLAKEQRYLEASRAQALATGTKMILDSLGVDPNPELTHADLAKILRHFKERMDTGMQSAKVDAAHGDYFSASETALMAKRYLPGICRLRECLMVRITEGTYLDMIREELLGRNQSPVSKLAPF